MVGGIPGACLVPVPAVLGRVTPLGLCCTGGDNKSKWGQSFTTDVGRLIERLLIEVKSTRPNEQMRLGGPDFTALLRRTPFKKGFEQIN
ncbi:hypothetical protein ACFQ7O_01270 [Streptomyces sp. NPDC056485]|uniref:hypothetical protein n=1 Tax=Streptomyces sp. NPDC056485 TaxID=3345834 RepID=UPI0036B5D6AE